MPRENRKRGKKNKKKAEEVAEVPEEHPARYEEEAEAGPSWIVPARDNSTIDQNAPFGFVDAEVKAYFRTVDVQIREWQETKPEVEADEDVDPNEGAPHLSHLCSLHELESETKTVAYSLLLHCKRCPVKRSSSRQTPTALPSLNACCTRWMTSSVACSWIG